VKNEDYSSKRTQPTDADLTMKVQPHKKLGNRGVNETSDITTNTELSYMTSLSGEVAKLHNQKEHGVQPGPSASPIPITGYVSHSDVHPFPTASRKNTNCGRKKGSTKVLTDTSERQELVVISEIWKRTVTQGTRKPKKCLFKAKKSCSLGQNHQALAKMMKLK